MSPDYARASFTRLYHQEPAAIRDLSFVTKAMGAYIRTLVDPHHGWIALHGQCVATALRHHATGTCPRSEQRTLTRAVGELLSRGQLQRCRVFDTTLGTITTADEREIELSPWLEDPEGDWMVITDWVPSERGLTSAETRQWHEARIAALAEFQAT